MPHRQGSDRLSCCSGPVLQQSPVSRPADAGRIPEAEIVILADLVKGTGKPDHNAIKAAEVIGAKLAIPDFGPDRQEGWTDFNDLATIKGIDEVKNQIEGATVATVAKVAVAEWPEPISLIGNHESASYPLEALPGIIGEAVREVVGFVQCPVPLAACSALSAVSTVVQGLADIRRSERLEGPTSLYCLAIADAESGNPQPMIFFQDPSGSGKRKRPRK